MQLYDLFSVYIAFWYENIIITWVHLSTRSYIKHLIGLQEKMVVDMMYDMDEELNRLERPDGSKQYPAMSCKAIKDSYPDKLDG